jgi:hypothetical protein
LVCDVSTSQQVEITWGQIGTDVEEGFHFKFRRLSIVVLAVWGRALS